MRNNQALKQWRLAGGLALVAAALGCQQQSDLGKYANMSIALDMRKSLAGASGEGAAAAESTSTGWATLKGSFTYVGDPPTLPPYNVSKDHDACAPGGNAPKQEYLLVDDQTKGVANVVVFVRKVSRVHDSAAPRTDKVVFDQKECVFLSHVLGVTVGQTLDIKNSDPVGHNTSISGQNTFNQIVASGGATDAPIKKEEAVPAAVSCSIHPWMRAYLLPRKNGYFAVTAKDGTFEIPNLPAGEQLEFQVWHESAPGSTHGLVVDTPEAKELNWSDKGRFKVKLTPDETREIKLAVPASAFGG
jgi:plastocyanin